MLKSNKKLIVIITLLFSILIITFSINLFDKYEHPKNMTYNMNPDNSKKIVGSNQIAIGTRIFIDSIDYLTEWADLINWDYDDGKSVNLDINNYRNMMI